jgi:hypothetical protein
MAEVVEVESGRRPNTRVQRTRLRSPLTRHPLGAGKEHCDRVT